MVELISKPAPARVNGRPSSSLGTIHQEGYPIFLYESALDQIIEFSERELSRELGGFLLGGIYKDKRDYIEIEHFLPAVEARSQLASFTFTHDTWAEMNRSVALKYPDKTVVGWHHTSSRFWHLPIQLRHVHPPKFFHSAMAGSDGGRSKATRVRFLSVGRRRRCGLRVYLRPFIGEVVETIFAHSGEQGSLPD